MKEGDKGDSMYIILRGSANVLIKRTDVDGKEWLETVAVVYDGNHFGEIALLKKYKDGE